MISSFIINLFIVQGIIVSIAGIWLCIYLRKKTNEEVRARKNKYTADNYPIN